MTEIENFSERFVTFRTNTDEFVILIMGCIRKNKIKLLFPCSLEISRYSLTVVGQKYNMLDSNIRANFKNIHF